MPGTTAAGEQPLTWVPENAPKKVLVPTGPIDDAWRGGADFDDSAWISGTGGVGFERSSGYESYFSINVVQRDVRAKCELLYPYSVRRLGAGLRRTYPGFSCKVRYDDAFVAYLNGAGGPAGPVHRRACMELHRNVQP